MQTNSPYSPLPFRETRLAVEVANGKTGAMTSIMGLSPFAYDDNTCRFTVNQLLSQ